MPDLDDGESIEMQGSGSRPYLLKNTGGVYSCTCPAWRNQSLPIEQRTCKHLRAWRGETAEVARLGTHLPAQTLTFSLIGAPDGPIISSDSGQFFWKPKESHGPGDYTFQVAVSEAQRARRIENRCLQARGAACRDRSGAPGNRAEHDPLTP